MKIGDVVRPTKDFTAQGIKKHDEGTIVSIGDGMPGSNWRIRFSSGEHVFHTDNFVVIDSPETRAKILEDHFDYYTAITEGDQ